MSLNVPPRIGVLLDHIESDYHVEMLLGVLRAARQRHARTVIIPGGALSKSGGPRVVRNFIYDFLLSARLDGLVVLAGSLANYCGVDGFRAWLPRYDGIPTVTVQLDLPPLPSVHVDNRHGVHAVVSHLIEVHHRQRIAFLRGPEVSSEAEARRLAYQQTLLDHGLRVDERLITPPGGFGREDGMAGVQTLFDERHLTPAMLDAIVGANDHTALGALEELGRRGISVPDQVAIAGFDDAPAARASNPPLTTVNQLVEMQGFSATRNLLDALQSGGVPSSTPLAPAVVLRGSCGCVVPFRNSSRSVRPPLHSAARSCRLALIERRGTITAALLRDSAGRLLSMSGWDGKLLDSLTQELSDPIGGSFMREIERLARRSVALGTDVMAFHDVLTTLRLQALSCAVVEPEIRPRLEDLFQEARYMLARMITDVEREQVSADGLHMRLIAKACLLTLSSGSCAELRVVLAEQLPALGVHAYSVSRFRGKSGVTPELEVIARRAAGVWRQQIASVEAGRFGLDSALESEVALVIQPLEFGDTPVGLGVFAWGARNPLIYEQLRELLSPALHASVVRG
jgi:sigma-B regulation protein RsbU (phosphoserine phosphatase)